MKKHINHFAILSLTTLAVGYASLAFAEDKATHKHHKATMPEATHQQYMEKQKNEAAPSDSDKQTVSKHSMRNGVQMQGKTHREHANREKQEDLVDASKEKKSHKHHKMTMEGEKHNQ
ncbi:MULTISPECIES: hypothetical protein [Cellvibrionaceae]|jgi:hypothetical protein|uniref:Uncharacterized protein n=1 Tax=Marinagarivorans cellulosilyticus TaxID=2721545 RepID=A0AAN2BL56_9GAMM|nr:MULTISPECIES: hypothetical protein [Cellvibrionaceae]PHR96027.1 MAG: hypothetical protein COA68_16425 [Oceanobacter sp.]BCD98687.1 hypothetical protein MARGE09_P2888 [Marinagarivorans cellulosilyticus]|tara:strand:+ start:663 stop:1016 length:354 start_codon:yes stop_codon:yes gene_type:complete